MKRRGWGGTHDELVRRLSPTALAELIAAFGGQIIRVPRKIRETRAERTERILALLTDHSYRETAAAVGCSPRTVVSEGKRST